MSERHRDFVIESREHLTTFEQSLLALEATTDPGEVRTHIDRSLRAVHSIKGDAGFLGFGTVRSLAHAMEDLLENFRTGEQPPPVPVVEALLFARDRLAALVDDLEHCHTADVSEATNRLSSVAPSTAPIEIDVDLKALAGESGGRLVAFFRSLARLGTFSEQRLIASGDLAQPLPDDAVRLLARLSPRVADDEVRRVLGRAAITMTPATPEQVHRLSVELGGWCRSSGLPLVGLLTDLAKAGRLTEPELVFGPIDLAAGVPEGPVILRGKLHSAEAVARLQERTGLPASAFGDDTEPASATGSVPTDIEISPAIPATAMPRIAPAARTSGAKAGAAAALADSERLSSLRINVELLDRLMTLIGELTLVRNQSLLAFSGEEGTPRAIIQRLNAVTSELQETVLRTRMQPVGNLFGRFPRMVRDLSKQLGKQVEVVTDGREVELDKTVLEQLSDPLTHLIRNCIDHGIERPDERVANGKPPAGQVTLSAMAADGQVLIEIRDDGRGIDPAAIRAKALALRLKTEAELERLSPKELFALILLPGFSTAKQVTEVSGRGVGMDVVKTNLDQLEGSLTIDSTPGRGTSMLLRVPLTLAIIPCLIVEVGDERFAVPQRGLEEIVCLHPGAKGAIEQAFDAEVFRLRDRLIPIVRFSEVLDRPERFTAETKAELLRKYDPARRESGRIEYILVLKSQGKRFGLLVDQVRGTQEIVVKPMHAAMKRLGIFAGATLMGDGRVALIANVDGIVEHADCRGSEARMTATTTTIRDPAEIHRILLFESGPEEQFALPLIQIRRIEAIDVERIVRVGNQEFVTLEGVATRIVRLEQALGVSACRVQPTMYLILPKFVPEPMGILVSRIVDTDTLAIDLQRATIADPGVLGIAIVRERLSLFIDVQYIRERTFGKPAALAEGEQKAASPGERRVLLIDDTPFFREVVKRYLEEAGIAVTTAVDGQDGLDKLAAEGFDAVVCDIEMPNLDGWGFVQAARERGCRLPILALSSLSRAEHEDRARACGFDEFQEKLDHDRLLRTVRRLLDESWKPLSAGGRR